MDAQSSEFESLVGPDQIRMLLAIAEARSFSGAAVALGVSQPSISQQVKRLEQRAGRVLFRRVRTGVELTSDGEALVIYARAMVALTDDLRRHFRDTAGTIRLSIGMAEDFCRTALPSVLRLFMLEHPKIEMRFISGSAETLIAAAEARTVDLVVKRRDPRFSNVETLWTDKAVWIGRPDLTLPIADPVPLIVTIEASPMREALIETLRAHGRTWRVVFESRTLAGFEAAMEAGLGVCACARSMRLFGAATLPARHGLPDLPDIEYVMSTPDQKTTGVVAAFAEVLRQAAIAGFRPGAVGS